MTTAQYDLVILNHNSCKSIENLVQELLVILGKVGDPYMEYKLSEALLFEQNSSVILDNIDQAEGEIYQEKFRELDVETALRPTLQLVAREVAEKDEGDAQYTCPACQHVQPKQKETDAMRTCESCGVVGEKFKKNDRKQEVFQQEKRKLEQNQNQQMQAALERAQHDDEASMRDEARQELGVKSKHHYGTTLAGLGILAIIGTTTYFVADKMDRSATAQEGQTAATGAPGTGAPGDGTQNAEGNTTELANTKGKQQPMLTIQAGNGSIVVNNGPQDDSKDTGKGGSKGSSTGEAVAANSSGSDSNVAKLTSKQAQAPNTANTAANATATTTAAANNLDTSSNTQQPVATTAASTPNNDQQPVNANTQLAALSPTKQHTATTQKTAINSATVLSAAAIKKPKILEGVATSANELQQLKAMLQTKYGQSKQFFARLDQQQFTDHQERLKRLLGLGKPDLALIFAESVEDSYLASLLILEVAKFSSKKRNTELNDAILLGMKAQVKRSSSVANSAMLNASLSQAYDFTGDTASAHEALKRSVQLLNHGDISISQSCELMAQINQNHQQFGNQNGADFMAGTLIEFANKLPAKDHRYRPRIYTHLAATALRDDKQQDAAEWLKHIPVQNAQHELLAELKTIQSKNKAKK